MQQKKVWLIGSGHMAMEYAKILMNQNLDFQVIGRLASAKAFATLLLGKPGRIPLHGIYSASMPTYISASADDEPNYQVSSR